MLKGVNDCSKPPAGCLTCELSPYCVSILKHKLFRPSRIECRSRQKSRFSGYISGVLHSSHSWDQNLWKVSSGTFTGQKVTESMTYKHIRTNKKMAEKHNCLAYFTIQIKKTFFFAKKCLGDERIHNFSSSWNVKKSLTKNGCSSIDIKSLSLFTYWTLFSFIIWRFSKILTVGKKTFSL